MKIKVDERPRLTRTIQGPDRKLRRHAGASRTTALVMSASLGTIAAVGFSAPAQAQTAAEACAFAASLRSVDTVSRVLTQYPDDVCVPAMLAEIPPRVLRRLPPGLVAGLSPGVLQYFPSEVLADFGITGSIGPQRSITTATVRPAATTPY